MPNPSSSAALQQALAACQRGAWSEAERLCRSVLSIRPDVFEAVYLLGVVAGRTGRPREAARLMAQAAALQPRHVDAHFNRGVALSELGRHEEAAASYAAALAIGALGKPLWIVLPSHQHDWRWQRQGETTPWYSQARLVRQARPGDWAGVVGRVHAGLRAQNAPHPHA